MSYRFQAEVLTPLVIAGADNKNPNVLAEGLRPPSLRGAMRWWFRAMMGGIVGAHDNYKALRDLEGKIFGATEQGSSVRLRTYPIGDMKADKAYLCMNDDQGQTKSGTKRSNISKPSIWPPSKFLIRIDGYNKDGIILALSSLWLLTMLGGLGNRARRGFGSLALTPEDEQTKEAVQKLELDFSYPDKPLKDIKDALETPLKKVHEYFTSYVPTISSPPPAQFPVLSKTQAKLWLIKPQNGFWNSWSNAMDDLREHIYRGYKRTKGLQEIGSAKPGSRLASPLIIQIKRAAQDKYFGGLLAFDEQHNKQQYLGANWGGFRSFLNGLASYEYQEVTLP